MLGLADAARAHQDIAWGVMVKERHSSERAPGGLNHESATCVQRFDDSLIPAIHTTYRISLRSSSSREPRYPLLGVVIYVYLYIITTTTTTAVAVVVVVSSSSSILGVLL